MFTAASVLTQTHDRDRFSLGLLQRFVKTDRRTDRQHASFWQRRESTEMSLVDNTMIQTTPSAQKPGLRHDIEIFHFLENRTSDNICL